MSNKGVYIEDVGVPKPLEKQIYNNKKFCKWKQPMEQFALSIFKAKPKKN